jgi:putative nucleotidyltransferase with HDIG domain
VKTGAKHVLLNSGDVPDWAYSAVAGIMQSLKIVDPETYAHCLRVGEYSRKLAISAGLTPFQQKVAEFSGILHDVGKMGVDRAIVHKPGKLDDFEMAKMKDHPVLSAEIVKPLADQHIFFQQVLPGVLYHHERMDGLGYPHKKMGDEIPLISRLILIVDTLDAMSSSRAYRQGQPIEKVYRELNRCKGTQFDTERVHIFLDSHSEWDRQAADAETQHRLIKKVA